MDDARHLGRRLHLDRAPERSRIQTAGVGNCGATQSQRRAVHIELHLATGASQPPRSRRDDGGAGAVQNDATGEGARAAEGVSACATDLKGIGGGGQAADGDRGVARQVENAAPSDEGTGNRRRSDSSARARVEGKGACPTLEINGTGGKRQRAVAAAVAVDGVGRVARESLGTAQGQAVAGVVRGE